MAIDKNRTKELVEEIDQLFEVVTENLPNDVKRFIESNVMGPAFDEIKKLISDSRPPRLFLIGRSGHGKSSVINALAGKKVAEVDDIKPCTPESVEYLITFNEQYSSWSVIDSRGFFESTKPSGAMEDNASESLKQDIRRYNPDIIMHVINARETRTLENDLKLYSDLITEYKNENGVIPPTIIVMNSVDTLGNPREWPPEQYARKAALIRDALVYLAKDVLGTKDLENIDRNSEIKGYSISYGKTNEQPYVGLIPTCALEGDVWNIDTLSSFIGEYLPQEAVLDFFQGLRRKECLRKISSDLIKRFSVIAGGIGAAPIPIADIMVLTPLQMLLIALIGGLSCRKFSKETATEFLVAAGLQVGGGIGLRMVAQQLVKLIPGFGLVISGGIASAGTYGIGKCAEAYFFSGEIKKPDDFIKEA